jgi:hypothetical protein
MQFIKISCAECSHCAECSKTTRMYVNYCGSEPRKVMERIRAARGECSQRRGHTLNMRQRARASLLPKTCAA